MDRATSVSAADARALVDMAHRRGGLSLDASKIQFFETRLGSLINDASYGSVSALVAAAQVDASVADTVLERLTTHTTSFFREPGHYDWLTQNGLTDLTQRALTTSEPFTIWSAACSTGVELWSAGMVWLDWQTAAKRRDPFTLIGTDISRRVLQICEGATYRDDEVQGVSPDRRQRYLLSSRNARDSVGKPFWRIVSGLRTKASFLQANLQRLEQLRPFKADVIFLRNVLIYFDAADRDRAVSNVTRRLRPGGVLLTGHAERIEPESFGLRADGPSRFRKVS